MYKVTDVYVDFTKESGNGLQLRRLRTAGGQCEEDV